MTNDKLVRKPKKSKLIDLTGKRFGKLVVIERDVARVGKQPYWFCLCECGNRKSIPGSHLRGGTTKTCGCSHRELCMRTLKDITGQVFSRLTVIKRVTPIGVKPVLWLCSCSCGKEISTTGDRLRSGASKTCGCSRIGRARTHGQSTIPEYRVWRAMKDRCLNPKDRGYKNYGGRGIKVCERWHKYENFIADMGRRPSDEFSIERRNVNGNYEPSNCYWMEFCKQSRNRRFVSYLEWNGERDTLASWSRRLGVSYQTARERMMKGWTPKEILYGRETVVSP